VHEYDQSTTGHAAAGTLLKITIESVTRTYGGFTAVDDISLTAQPGRVTGFLGPNGAGKSTTMRIIVGLTKPTSGLPPSPGAVMWDLPNPGLEVGCYVMCPRCMPGAPAGRP
jgi:ABC-type uncharacterized transport system ATPase subunit